MAWCFAASGAIVPSIRMEVRCHTVLVILLTTVSPLYAEDPMAKHTFSMEDTTNNMVDRIFDEVLGVWPLHGSGTNVPNQGLSPEPQPADLRPQDAHRFSWLQYSVRLGDTQRPSTRTWSVPRRSEFVRKRDKAEPLGAVAGIEKSVPSVGQETLAKLDAIFKDSPSEATAEFKRMAAKSISKPRAEPLGRKDQRAEFRSLGKQFQRQVYIMSLLVRNVSQPSGIRGAVPNLEWIGKERDGGENLAAARSMGLPETSLPVVMRSHPLAPGELMILNVVEPRWMNLFAKLTANEESSQILRSATRYQDVMLKTDPVLSGALKLYELNMSNTEERDRLQTELSHHPMYSKIVSGYGRLNESIFAGTKRFAACLKTSSFGREKPSNIGTVVEIIGTDVRRADDGTPVFVVIARGVERFQTVRVRQEKPYFVVDAVPLVESVEQGKLLTDHATKRKILGVLNGQLEKEARNGINRTRNLPEAEKDSFRKVLRDMHVYVKMDAHNLNVLALASMIMRHKPKAAQSLLASTSAQQRQALVEKWLLAGRTKSPSSSPETIWGSQVMSAWPLIPAFLVLAILWNLS